tara:strand:- start:21254 stop:21892 length:639 start_codon:yes stop_codon:yes gene_type:complete
MAGKNQQKKQDLDDEFDQIKQQHSGKIDISKYMVDSDEDMPGFGEIELYDYKSDIDKSKATGHKIIKDLVDLYLSDVPDIKEHPYIQSRMDEDAEYYSQMKVIQKLSEKLLLQEMRQIDAGDVSPRMYEITSKHIGEMRENIKDGRKARLEIEDMYKKMRLDLGLNETARNDSYKIEDGEEDDVKIVDTSKLNDTIDNYLKQRKSDDNNEIN